jgi:hypothetical protein
MVVDISSSRQALKDALAACIGDGEVISRDELLRLLALGPTALSGTAAKSFADTLFVASPEGVSVEAIVSHVEHLNNPPPPTKSQLLKLLSSFSDDAVDGLLPLEKAVEVLKLFRPAALAGTPLPPNLVSALEAKATVLVEPPIFFMPEVRRNVISRHHIVETLHDFTRLYTSWHSILEPKPT